MRGALATVLPTQLWPAYVLAVLEEAGTTCSRCQERQIGKIVSDGCCALVKLIDGAAPRVWGEDILLDRAKAR